MTYASPRVVVVRSASFLVAWWCACLASFPRGSHARRHAGGTPHHLNANGEERLIGWKGETHSVAGAARQATTDANLAVRNTLVSQMDFGSGHACELEQTGGLSLKGAVPATGVVMPPAYPGDWVARYKQVAATDVASVQLNYMHMAMIETLHNGSLALAWQTAPKIEGDRRQHIVLTFANPASVAETRLGSPFLSWAPPTRVDAIVGDGGGGSRVTDPDAAGGAAETIQGALWGPALLNDPTPGKEDVLWLFYAESRGGCGSRVPGMDWAPGGDLKATTYNIVTGEWTKPMLVLSQDTDGGVPKVTANKPAVLSNGHWVLPYWRERAMLSDQGEACEEMRGKEGAGVVISEDGRACAGVVLHSLLLVHYSIRMYNTPALTALLPSLFSLSLSLSPSMYCILFVLYCLCIT